MLLVCTCAGFLRPTKQGMLLPCAQVVASHPEMEIAVKDSHPPPFTFETYFRKTVLSGTGTSKIFEIGDDCETDEKDWSNLQQEDKMDIDWSFWRCSCGLERC